MVCIDMDEDQCARHLEKFMLMLIMATASDGMMVSLLIVLFYIRYLWHLTPVGDMACL